MFRHCWGYRTTFSTVYESGRGLESPTIAGDSPVQKLRTVSGILSSAGHVKSCVNSPEPSGKAKYNKRPIAYKYCEGKVKRTSNRGVK